MFQVSLVRDDNVSIHLALFAKFFIRTLEIFRNSILQDRRGNFKIFLSYLKIMVRWRNERKIDPKVAIYFYINIILLPLEQITS